MFGARERIFYLERMRKVKSDLRLAYKYKNAARWIEVSIEICQALNLNRNESAKVLSRICQWQNHLGGLRIYQLDKELINLARWIEEAIEKKPRNLDGSRFRQDLLIKENEGVR